MDCAHGGNDTFLINTTQHVHEHSFIRNISDQAEYSEQTVVKVGSFLVLYLQPLLCSTGVLGNSISVLVFSKLLRKTSSNIYLVGLSFASVVLCICAFLFWLDTVDIKVASKPFLCQSFVYLAYVSSFLVVWFVVCITCENYIITIHTPLAVRICTPNNAKVTVCLLSIIALVLYSYALWTTESNDGYCSTREINRKTVESLAFVDAMLTLIIPSIAIISFICPVLVNLLCRRQSRACCKRAQNTNRPTRGRRSKESLLRVTRVLLVIGLTYVVFAAPMYVNQLRIISSSHTMEKLARTEMALHHICLTVYYTTFTLYFFVNLVWCQNYRKCLRKIVFCSKRPKRSLASKVVSLPLIHMCKVYDQSHQKVNSV